MSIDDVRLIEFSVDQIDDMKRVDAITGQNGGATEIPFKVQRVFYMFASDGNVIRGRHANRRSEFVLINVCGSSKGKVDDGRSTKVFELNTPNKGLYIPKMIWKDMYDFSEDSVLLVLSSEKYDAGEYVRDYEEYVIEQERLNSEKDN